VPGGAVPGVVLEPGGDNLLSSKLWLDPRLVNGPDHDGHTARTSPPVMRRSRGGIVDPLPLVVNVQ
jgi:hypothetical protein